MNTKATPDNLAIWQAVEKTDPTHTKPFQKTGGFKGTAINATALARRATEVFGPMGIGWGLEIMDEALMEGAPLDDHGTRELIHKVRVKLWYKWGGERGEIVQFGQTQFVGKNKYGYFSDEEAPKKSITDGMSKCLSLLGFAADIHLGRYDDNKYVQEVTAEFREKHAEERRVERWSVTKEQAAELARLIKETGADNAKFCEYFKVQALADLPADSFDEAQSMLAKKARQNDPSREIDACITALESTVDPQTVDEIEAEAKLRGYLSHVTGHIAKARAEIKRQEATA